jgi:hypothetical protein
VPSARVGRRPFFSPGLVSGHDPCFPVEVLRPREVLLDPGHGRGLGRGARCARVWAVGQFTLERFSPCEQ